MVNARQAAAFSINDLIEASRAGRLPKPATRAAAERSALRATPGQLGLVAALLGVQGCKTVEAPAGFEPVPSGANGGGGLTPPPTPGPAPEAPATATLSVDALIASAEHAPAGAILVSIDNVVGGSAVIDGAFIRFTASPGLVGAPTFSFTVVDPNGAHSQHSVTIGLDAFGSGHDHAASSNGDPTQSHDHDANAAGDTTVSNAATSAHDHNGDRSLDASMAAHETAALNLVPLSEATNVAVKNGSWFDPTTWANGKVPADGANVVIPEGVTVTYDAASNASIKTVRVDGALEFATDVDTFIEVDTLVVTRSGKLTIGTEADPVAADVEAVIQIANNGPIDVAWDPQLLSRGIVSFGAVEVHGAEKENFIRLSSDALKGQSTLTLADAPNGWQVGDKIVLTATHLANGNVPGADAPAIVPTEDEEFVIKAINGNVITLDRPLTYDHEGARSDLKAYVANYTRNVVIETEDGTAVPTHQRGHVMLMHSDDISLKFAEFSELGRTDKKERAFDLGDLSTVAADSNIKGRYPLHIHRTGIEDPANPVVLEGNSVWKSPGWGIVHHDSNALIDGNATYDTFGAAFVAETGNETGRWSDNIAIKVFGVDHIVKHAGDVAAFDLGRTGSGFWFQGRLVDAVGNVAASVPSGAGFTYFHRAPEGDVIPVDADAHPLSDILRYNPTSRANTPNISIFKDNETIGAERGLEIIKANPRQSHDVRSVIDGFTAWEVEIGVNLQYTAHYTFSNLDLVGTDSRIKGVAAQAGVILEINVLDVVFNGANVEGFPIGFNQVKQGASGLSFLDTADIWNYAYIDVNVKGASVAFSNPTASDRHLTSAELWNGPLSYQSAYGETQIRAVNSLYTLAGDKTDSLGRVAVSQSWDPHTIDPKELHGAVTQNGWWTTADGRRVTLVEEYIADRATGELIKVGLFVELGRNFNPYPGDPYNGVLNLNSRAPVAGADFASVRQGDSVVIDVLANDRDLDGDRIYLDGLFSQHGHVVENQDGTVTYFAQPDFVGADTFHYFVQDSNGDITRQQVTVTVEI